jgi:hypothetical protein
MKRGAMLICGLAVLAAAAGPASAAYIASYEGWSKLTQQDKATYVEGLSDASNVVETGEAYNAVRAAVVNARATCLYRDKVTSQMLAALIDNQYHNDPSAHDLPPMTIYLRETYRICRQDIEPAVEAAHKPDPQS